MSLLCVWRSCAVVCIKFTLVLVFTAYTLTSKAEPVILVVGDSISAGFGIPVQEGWVSIMERQLKSEFPSVRVVNASISGDTTQGGATRLPTLLKQYQPQLTIIELGGNDGLRGIPINIMRSNLQRMIKMAQTAGSDVMLLGMQIPPNYGARYTDLFKNSFVELAREFNLLLVPFLLEGVAQHPHLMQNDGIHPTQEAQPIMTALVEPEVRLWLKKQ